MGSIFRPVTDIITTTIPKVMRAGGDAIGDLSKKFGTKAELDASAIRKTDAELGASVPKDRTPPPDRDGLPTTAATAERRRARDKADGNEPNWKRLTERYWGERPADMERPHGHHIVFKEGPPGPIRDMVDESKAILERHGIDWYTGADNLIWAPNRGHSLANATQVRDMLAAADQHGRQAVIDALRAAGRNVFDGRP